MNWNFPTTYTDSRGYEKATITNNGKNLSICLRGIKFSGNDFDLLRPVEDSPQERLKEFTISDGALCGCTLESELPIVVVTQLAEQSAVLNMHLVLGYPTAGGGLDQEALSLTLCFEQSVYRSDGASGWFEDELLSLQRAMPVGSHLKACISCAYSDYSPYGHGLFGGMACFRNFKAEYSHVHNKHDLFPILDKADRVQETYLCEDFEKRRPKTGYRG